MSDPITFVVADDNPDARHLVRVLSRTTPEVELIGEVGDGDVAVQLLAELQPDAVLLDLHMPTSGLTVLPVIRAVAPNTCVIAWSSDEEGIEQALEAGANDGVVKTAPWREVADRIVAVATTEAGGSKCEAPDTPRPTATTTALVLADVDVHSTAPFAAPVAASTLWPCPACRERRPLEGSQTLVVSDRSGFYRNERSVVVCAVCAEQVSVSR